MIAKRGGRRRGAGRPPIRGTAQTVRRQLVLTEAEAAEISDAVYGEPVGPWMVNASLLHARAMRDPNLRAGLTRAMSLLEIEPGSGIDAEVVRMTIAWLEEQVTGRPSCEVTDEIRRGAKAEIKRLLG